MKKAIVFILLAIVACFSLAACGNTNPPEDNQIVVESADQTASVDELPTTM